MTELLTDDEHRAMQLLAEVRRLLGRIIAEGADSATGTDSRSGDSREVAWHIHGLQNMVLSQAAARAYPHRYRLLGEGLRVEREQ